MCSSDLAGVIHRDLKPSNVLRRESGQLVIADFGISRPLDESGEHTTVGSLLGSPAYMSPEQCLGQALDARADLYSAGVIFAEMLMGARPFRGDNVASVLYQHVHGPLPQLPDGLDRHQPLLNALLAKDPSGRIDSAAEALKLLDSSK